MVRLLNTKALPIERLLIISLLLGYWGNDFILAKLRFASSNFFNS